VLWLPLAGQTHEVVKVPVLLKPVTERYRMSLREGEDWDELYDLENDPHELHNCFDQDDMKGVRAELTETMLKRVISLQDRAPLPAYRA